MNAKRATLGAAVLWIAQNDAPGDKEKPSELAGYISVVLVADLFGKSAADVARLVHFARTGDGGTVSDFRILCAAYMAGGMSERDARLTLATGLFS